MLKICYLQRDFHKITASVLAVSDRKLLHDEYMMLHDEQNRILHDEQNFTTDGIKYIICACCIVL